MGAEFVDAGGSGAVQDDLLLKNATEETMKATFRETPKAILHRTVPSSGHTLACLGLSEGNQLKP